MSTSIKQSLVVLSLVFDDGRNNMRRSRVLQLIFKLSVWRFSIESILIVIDVFILINLKILLDLIRLIVLNLPFYIIFTFNFDHVNTNNLSNSLFTLAFTIIGFSFVILILVHAVVILKVDCPPISRLHNS